MITRYEKHHVSHEAAYVLGRIPHSVRQGHAYWVNLNGSYRSYLHSLIYSRIKFDNYIRQGTIVKDRKTLSFIRQLIANHLSKATKSEVSRVASIYSLHNMHRHPPMNQLMTTIKVHDVASDPYETTLHFVQLIHAISKYIDTVYPNDIYGDMFWASDFLNISPKEINLYLYDLFNYKKRKYFFLSETINTISKILEQKNRENSFMLEISEKDSYSHLGTVDVNLSKKDIVKYDINTRMFSINTALSESCDMRMYYAVDLIHKTHNIMHLNIDKQELVKTLNILLSSSNKNICSLIQKSYRIDSNKQ